MKKRVFLTTALIFSLYLTGCARNNVNDDVAYRNANEPTRVNYNTPNHGGPALTGVDVSDNRLDYNANRRDNDLLDVRNDNRSKMRVADDAARKVADLPDVDRANVIVTENNAYVAAKLDRSARNGLTSNIENQISRAVKSVDRDIDRVYVSVNPDFYDRFNNYAGDIRNGRPVSGFFDEFTKTIRRVFPDAR
ncbi:YhcN/YlaJ family sporulation lipoprotein [Neobacillus mesonae]|uniref:YhcN/YlaJ family sporulation lipoprotein n=1 Tax=Neobacillus mesonae TaxID=1193713 RepID=A0A3Q9R042_9BACI|nr:YhcN/YlaJ family sporulation lipoprotein [Neobacillus mesonae]AZU62989.1 YhcN/YlaJ family sporulation lipoprotein [Neobacillus mesonae]